MKTLDQLIDEQRERAKCRRGGHASNLRLVPVPPKRERKGKPFRLTPEQSREYRLAQRGRWLMAGIVRPKDEAERAWLAADKWLLGRAA